jgi:hypothetical protein
MSNAFYSILPAISAVICSIILFLRIKRNKILGAQDLFWHYAFAFGIIALTSIPIFLINLGVEVSYNNLYIIYAFIVLMVFISYLLFFRGTVLLFTKERFFPAILPLLILPAVAAFSLISLSFLNFSSIIIYTAFAWGFLFVNSNLLGSIFIFSFATGSPIKNIKRKFCALLLSLGWFSVLGLDVILWINAASYHPEFWILRIASLKEWFLVRAIVYLIILIGALSLGRCLQRNKIQEEQ